MPPIQYKEYPTRPPYIGHSYRPADWPEDENYREVFQVTDTGKWFGVDEDPRGGRNTSAACDTKEEAVDFVMEHILFLRSFWDQKVEWANNGDMTLPDKNDRIPRRVVRIGHMHYIIGPEPGPGERAGAGWGHGGREFHIKLMSTGEVVVTHNLWCQGSIPKEYWDALPDNAEIVGPPARPPIMVGQLDA